MEGGDYTVNDKGIPCCPHDPSLPMKREGSRFHLRCGLPTMKFICPKMKWEWNNILTRAFTKAWKLLITHTTLKERYWNIQLPDTDAKYFKALWIPTSSSLDKVFLFKHDGKIRK